MPDPAGMATTDVDLPTLLEVLEHVKAGDFRARKPLHWTGLAGKVADGINDVIAANQALESELARVAQVVGKEGKLSRRAPRVIGQARGC